MTASSAAVPSRLEDLTDAEYATVTLHLCRALDVVGLPPGRLSDAARPVEMLRDALDLALADRADPRQAP